MQSRVKIGPRVMGIPTSWMALKVRTFLAVILLFLAIQVAHEIGGIPQAHAEGPTASDWWFPWYDNVSQFGWLLISSPDYSGALCNVYIGYSQSPSGVIWRETVSIPGNGSAARQYSNLSAGPVWVSCTPGYKVDVSIRSVRNGTFNEVMGVAASHTDRYWEFPWYDNQGMNTSLLIGNTTGNSATCDVFIGTNPDHSAKWRQQVTLSPWASGGVGMQNLVDGPAVINCSQPVVASAQSYYGNGYNEVMGSPYIKFPTREWWLPWYDSQGMFTWMMNSVTGNGGSCSTYIGTDANGMVLRNTTSFTGWGTAAVQISGLIAGPALVRCDQPAVVSARSIYGGSFNETLAVPESALSSKWRFPSYDNFGMTTWLMIAATGAPDPTGTTTCNVYIGNTNSVPTFRGAWTLQPD